MQALTTPLEVSSDGVWRVPALVKGQLVHAPHLDRQELEAARTEQRDAYSGAAEDGLQAFRLGAAQVVCRPVDPASLDPRGEFQYIVSPYADPPEALVESDPADLADLYSLPFGEVLTYLAGLREILAGDLRLGSLVGEYARAISPLAGASTEVLLRMLPELLDPLALREEVDHQLGDDHAPGSRYLDDWVSQRARLHHGPTARLGQRVTPHALPVDDSAARVRAVPTRQLHITAGNSPLVPVLSLLRALLTKGAPVVKMSVASTAAITLMALAMHQLDPRHPITRHASVVYWRGGDRQVEDALLAPGAFDRIVVWGSLETLRSLGPRIGTTRAVLFQPRYGVSLIGKEAFSAHLKSVAARAAGDAMIANQAACTASLVHYVEAPQTRVVEYCRALQEALRAWDEAVPHRPTRSNLAQLRRLRRSEFLDGTWFENGAWPDTRSVVVYMPRPFDVAAHPMSRCVVVRRVDDLRDALPFIQPTVSSVGIYPEARRMELRDDLAARGVSTIAPLGATERMFPGMPHDGMRVLSELVNWTTA